MSEKYLIVRQGTHFGDISIDEYSEEELRKTLIDNLSFDVLNAESYTIEELISKAVDIGNTEINNKYPGIIAIIKGKDLEITGYF